MVPMSCFYKSRYSISLKQCYQNMQKLTHYTRRRADRRFRIFSNSPTPPTSGIFFMSQSRGFLLTRYNCRNKRRSEEGLNRVKTNFHTNIRVSCVESFLVSCTIGDEFDPEKSPRRLDERGLVTATKFSQTGRFFIIAISYSNVVTSANEGDQTCFQLKCVETELHSVSLRS